MDRRRVALWALLLALLVLGGCRSQPPPAHAMRWARAWINALNSHSVEQLGALVGPKTTYEDPLSNGPQSGLAVNMMFAWRWQRFPELRYQLRSARGDGQRVAVEWAMTGMGAATEEAPATGTFTMELRDNAITSVRGYFDPPPGAPTPAAGAAGAALGQP